MVKFGYVYFCACVKRCVRWGHLFKEFMVLDPSFCSRKRVDLLFVEQWLIVILRFLIRVQTLFSGSAAKSLQSCPTLCDPINGSPPGSAIPGILQARKLEWVAISFSKAWKWKVKVKSLSRFWLLATPWTAAYQAPPSMGFSRQEYTGVGCHCLLRDFTRATANFPNWKAHDRIIFLGSLSLGVVMCWFGSRKRECNWYMSPSSSWQRSHSPWLTC